MIIHECDQGSIDWHRARAGVITASMFAECRRKVGGLDERQQAFVDAVRAGMDRKDAAKLAGYTTAPRSATIEKAIQGLPVGDFSEAAQNYAFRVAVERIAGEPLDEGFEGYYAKRGKLLEDICRQRHEADIETLVTLSGFVTDDDGIFGASPDSLVDDDGGAEYKCFVDPAKLRAIIFENDWSAVMDQVQGGMWLTGRAWWDMCVYCPALDACGRGFTRHRAYRDDAYITAMVEDLKRFADLVDQYERRLRDGEAMPLTHDIDPEEEAA